MTLPVLPLLLPLEARSSEAAPATIDAAQAFRQALSAAVGASRQGSVFRLQASGQASGIRHQERAATPVPAPESLITAAVPPSPNAVTTTEPGAYSLPFVAGLASDNQATIAEVTSPGVAINGEMTGSAGIGLLEPQDVESTVPIIPAAALVTTPITPPTTEPPPAFVPAIPGALPSLPTTDSSSSGMEPPVAPELHPEFRDRLDRVIERMEAEFGYKVEVVETLRSQSRQDALYAQGREKPGQVVTWTRNSRHTDGLAADLLIDGSYTSALGYERLAQVAREEGLRTLGPRDRGHVELPRNVLAHTLVDGEAQVPASRASANVARPEWAALGKPLVASSHGERARQVLALNPNDNAPPRSLSLASEPEFVPAAETGARVATVAPVAPVAQVATVASVANVAVPGLVAPSARRSERVESPTNGRAATEGKVALRDAAATTQPADPRVNARSATASTDPVPSSMNPTSTPDQDAPLTDRDRREPTETPAPVEQFDGHHLGPVEKTAPDTSSTATRNVSPVDRASGLLSTDRVAELLDLRESAAERPLSSVLLRLDSPDGSEDRIRVGLRGASLGAAFDMADRNVAEDLGRHLTELARSVERQGLEPEHLQVRSSLTRDSVSTYSQAIAGEREGLRTTASTSAGSGNPSGRDGRPSRQDHQHEESPRHKSRRGSQGDR